MAFRYVFVISALVVLTQGSHLSPVEQESDVGVHHSGVAPSGAPVSGASRGNPSVSQPQRPASGYGSVGGPRRSSGSNAGRPRPHGATPRRSSGGSLTRPYGGANRPSANRHASGASAGHGNPHQTRSQKPY